MQNTGVKEVDAFIGLLRRDRKKSALRVSNAIESAGDVIALLSKDNVVLHNQEDNAFINDITERAKTHRIAFIDDSNYALLPNEAPSDVYKSSLSGEQKRLWDGLNKKEQFDPRDVDYLIAQKRAAYNAVANNGVIIATNHYHGKLVDFINEYQAKMYGFKQFSQWTKDQEFGYINAQRPEYLAIIGHKGETNVENFNKQRNGMVAGDSSYARSVSASGQGRSDTGGSPLSGGSSSNSRTVRGRESTGDSLSDSKGRRSGLNSGNTEGGKHARGSGLRAGNAEGDKHARGGVKKSTATKPKKSGSLASQIKALLTKKYRSVKKMLEAGTLEVVQSVEGLPKHLQWVANVLYHSAWHGSPHDHDKFSTDHIGTGEGAQVYGHGLYFSSSKAVAEHYRDNVTNLRAGHYCLSKIFCSCV